MRVDRLISVLSEITLIEMMVTIGLGVTFSDVLRVSGNYGRVARAALANNIVVPAGITPVVSCQAHDRRRISRRGGMPGSTLWATFRRDGKGKGRGRGWTNVGVSLVSLSSSFPGTPAVGSATAYALLQTIVVALVALTWGRLTPAGSASVRLKAA